jgi:hypothetical protein
MDASTRPARGPREHGELHETWRISAWKTYTQYGPNGKGYFLHDDVGIRFIEKARALGVKNICIHKGAAFRTTLVRAQPMQRHRRRRTVRDSVAQKRVAYLEKPDPHFRTYGPKTRREFLRVFDPAG